MPSAESTWHPTGESVLVCGLGRVGMQCLRALRGYPVPVRAIDLSPPAVAEREVVLLTAGDFRNAETLHRAGVAGCRSIVLLTSDPACNLEGAWAARRANPNIRLVVRAPEQYWHQLLSQRLGNLVVYEPNRLAASAFVFAALDNRPHRGVVRTALYAHRTCSLLHANVAKCSLRLRVDAAPSAALEASGGERLERV